MSRTIQRPVPPKISCQTGSVNMTRNSLSIRHLQAFNTIEYLQMASKRRRETPVRIDDSMSPIVVLTTRSQGVKLFGCPGLARDEHFFQEGCILLRLEVLEHCVQGTVECDRETNEVVPVATTTRARGHMMPVAPTPKGVVFPAHLISTIGIPASAISFHSARVTLRNARMVRWSAQLAQMARSTMRPSSTRNDMLTTHLYWHVGQGTQVCSSESSRSSEGRYRGFMASSRCC